MNVSDIVERKARVWKLLAGWSTHRNTSADIFKLPAELVVYLTDFLSAKGVVALSSTCKQFRAIITDEYDIHTTVDGDDLAALTTIATGWRNIRSLYFGRGDAFSRCQPGVFARLQRLQLCKCSGIGTPAFTDIMQSAGRHLLSLQIWYCGGFTRAVVQTIAKACVCIRGIRFGGCDFGDSAVEVLSACTTLEELDIRHCHNCSSEILHKVSLHTALRTLVFESSSVGRAQEPQTPQLPNLSNLALFIIELTPRAREIWLPMCQTLTVLITSVTTFKRDREEPVSLWYDIPLLQQCKKLQELVLVDVTFLKNDSVRELLCCMQHLHRISLSGIRVFPDPNYTDNEFTPNYLERGHVGEEFQAGGWTCVGRTEFPSASKYCENVGYVWQKGREPCPSSEFARNFDWKSI